MPSTVDSLLQLNVLLWCAIEQPPAGVYPVFAQHGYRLLVVAPKVGLPLPSLSRLKGLAPNQSANPEVVLSEADNLLMLECKPDSFTLQSGNAPQLWVLVTMCDAALRDALGLPTTAAVQSELLYVVPEAKGAAMRLTLDSARAEVTGRGLDAHDGGALEMSAQADGLHLTLVAGPALHSAPLDTDLRSGPRVVDWSATGEWRPLYLLPIDPSIAGVGADQIGRSILEARLLAPLLAAIGANVGPKEFVLSVDDALRSAIPVWDLWGDEASKGSLQTFAVKQARTLLGSLQAAGVVITSRGGRRYSVGAVSAELAGRVRRAIRRSPAFQLKIEQAAAAPELFPEN